MRNGPLYIGDVFTLIFSRLGRWQPGVGATFRAVGAYRASRGSYWGVGGFPPAALGEYGSKERPGWRVTSHNAQ